MQQVTCPACGAAFKYLPEYEGRPASCPSCGARFIVEASPQPPPIISSYVAPRRQPRAKDNKLLLASAISAAAFLAIGGAIYGLSLISESQSGSQKGASVTSVQDIAMAGFVGIIIVVCILASLALYAAPSIIAFNRGHQNKAAILALNILTGWSFVGWVASLVWALTEVRSRDNYHYHFGDRQP